MANRGAVLAARRRLGFGASGKPEHFLVLQADLFADLETVIVAPLVDHGPEHAGDHLAVPVSKSEAGASRRQVVLVHHLTSALPSRFDAGEAGFALPATMAAVDRAVRLLMGLLALDLAGCPGASETIFAPA